MRHNTKATQMKYKISISISVINKIISYKLKEHKEKNKLDYSK